MLAIITYLFAELCIHLEIISGDLCKEPRKTSSLD